MKTLLFVDDEPRVLQGLQRQLRSMRNEWDMKFAASGAEALEFMANQPVDIVISDMIMPAMDGAQLLNEVAKRQPQTVRIILSGHAEREALLRLIGPAHQYLSKPCDADELRGALVRATALHELLGNAQLKKLTTRIKNLPCVPRLYELLAAELGKESPPLENISRIISQDVGMTVKILQLANSAFLGRATPVNTTAEAVGYLGLETIRSLVLSLGIFSQYNQETCPAFSIDTLAQHAWLTGMLARTIAQTEHRSGAEADQCCLAGLLHDVGQLVLAFGLPEEYTQILAKATAAQKPIWLVEQEYFNATHAEVGAYLLALWGLPDVQVQAVAHHHQIDRLAASDFSVPVAVHIADVFAYEVKPCSTEAPGPALNREAIERLGLESKIEPWRTECRLVINSCPPENTSLFSK